jgi:hypothetical protein
MLPIRLIAALTFSINIISAFGNTYAKKIFENMS